MHLYSPHLEPSSPPSGGGTPSLCNKFNIKKQSATIATFKTFFHNFTQKRRQGMQKEDGEMSGKRMEKREEGEGRGRREEEEDKERKNREHKVRKR